MDMYDYVNLSLDIDTESDINLVISFPPPQGIGLNVVGGEG